MEKLQKSKIKKKISKIFNKNIIFHFSTKIPNCGHRIDWSLICLDSKYTILFTDAEIANAL